MVAILDQHGREIRSTELTRRPAYVQTFRRRLNARYDAAQTTDENERHWANADYLSPNAAMSPAIRRKTRGRARYEAQENNSYAKGMVLTLANDLISTGPRLQLGTEDKQANRRVERAFHDWADEIRLAEKLRTMRVAKAVDGETFASLSNNRRLMSQTKLDIRPLEADYFDSPWDAQPSETNGVRLDADGNVDAYYMLREHPGGTTWSSYGGDGDWVDYRTILHCYRMDRPGQIRGITELVTCLPLFAMLRRFTLATLAAAETAADFAAVMRTTGSASIEAESLPQDQWFDAIPLEYRAMLTLPNGWDITQLKAEHPTTTYAMFKQEIINEIARCLNMPFNVAAADSSEYNYASGRMDHQVYQRSIAVEQSQWECCILDRIFLAWLDEASLIPGLLPETGVPFAEWPWRWFWDGPGHVDPQKEANAQETRLRNHTTTLAEEWSRRGMDWEQQLQQRGNEVKLLAELGLTNGQTQDQQPQASDAEADSGQ